MKFYSRGKILFSGEYVVLFGAKALAVPSRLGQHLEVKQTGSDGIMKIRSHLNNTLWYSASFSLPAFDLLETTDESVSRFVKELFLAASDLKPAFFGQDKGFELTSQLEFDTRWGLGSSSSLISNIAWWMNIDPYRLFWKMSPGSGYDIACARSESPLIYRLTGEQPTIEPVSFRPAFRNSIYFVYLGNKQDSQYTVRDFRERVKPDPGVIREISEITVAFSTASGMDEFEKLMASHERILSKYLGIPEMKSYRFPGFPGAMKSLGAWGGDMVMVTWEDSEEELRRYFDTKGLKLVFRYDDLIL